MTTVTHFVPRQADQPEPDLRKEQPELGGLDCAFMTPVKTSDKSGDEAKKVGKGATLPRDVETHMRKQEVYTQAAFDVWKKWFTHAWPSTVEEHAQFLASLKDGSNPLTSHFHIPSCSALPKDDAAPGPAVSAASAGEHLFVEEIKPVPSVTHANYTEKQRRAALKLFEQQEQGHLLACQPRVIPPRVTNSRLLIYNLVKDGKGDTVGKWVPGTLQLQTKAGEKRLSANRRKMVAIPVGWWWLTYFDGEVLPFRLGDKDFKARNPGNGWIVDPFKPQPPELQPLVQPALDAQKRKNARLRGPFVKGTSSNRSATYCIAW